MIEIGLPAAATLTLQVTKSAGLSFVSESPALITPQTRGVSTLTVQLYTWTSGNLPEHEHEISDINGLQEALDAAGSGSGAIEVPFAWGDASPRSVAVATGGKLVYGIGLHISTAFNGVGAQISVGDAGDANRLMAAEQNDPTTAGSYTSNPTHRYGVDTDVLLTINPGAGGSAGNGLLTIFIEQ